MIDKNKLQRGIALLRDQNRRNKIHRINREQLIIEFENIGINYNERRELLWIVNGAISWVVNE
jgi:hypothetical protein